MQPHTTRRALLIGARAPDLRGVDHDLELMREALAHHGFDDIQVVVPATRDAMHTAITNLIDATSPGDAVVLYYSGHGSTLSHSYVDNPEHPDFGETSVYRFLVPSDIEESSHDDFRGYTNIELSEDLARLTEKTRNVAAILDCCFAGQAFRHEARAPEHIKWQDTSSYRPARHVALDGGFAESAARHYAKLRAHDRITVALQPEANPWAVLVLASAAGEPAFETDVSSRMDSDSYHVGVMTHALHAALLRVDPKLTTWQDIGRMVRTTPQRGSSQQIAVEGPYRRFLFSERERSPGGQLGLAREDGKIFVEGGRLAGLAVGDRVELFSLDRGEFRSVGTTTLEVVHSTRAEFGPFAAAELLDVGSYAQVSHFASPRAVLEIAGVDEATRTLLEARLRTDLLLQVVDTAESRGPLPLAGRISAVESGRIVLATPNMGELVELDRPRSLDPTCRPRTAAQLAEHLAESARRLARAAMLRSLPVPAASERLALPSTFSIDMYEVVGSRRGRRLASGDIVVSDRLITVEVSPPDTSTLYCTVLLVRADGMIRVLSQGQGGGVEISPGKGYWLGQRSRDLPADVRGVELVRPSSWMLAKQIPIEQTVVVVISERPVDLRSWEQPGVTRFNPRDPLSPTTTTRNLSAPPRCNRARYHVWSVTVGSPAPERTLRRGNM